MSHVKHIDPSGSRDLFEYRPEDGALVWREPHNRRVKAGDVAGSRQASGRHMVFIGGRYAPRSHAVYAWHHGAWPVGCVRHLNGKLADDRIENLHVETYFERVVRVRDLPKGTPGVRRSGRKWIAKITVKGKPHHLGTFATETEASTAFQAAHVALFGDQSPYGGV